MAQSGPMGVDRAAFREAMANAMVHRDYARFGAVHVQWERDELRISSPGGFVTGVTVGNLLVTPPKARNPLLADAFKRIGLVERSGRGVDRIYEGVLRYGRPAPDYSGSDNTGVTVRLSTADADVAFFRMIYDAEKRRGALHRAEVLVALSTLRELRRASEDDIAARMQRSGAAARAVLEELVETGLVAPQGSNRDRVYTLSSTVYSQLDKRAEYIRQVGFDGLQKEQMILAWVREHGHIKRPDVVELCRVSERQASRILETLVREGRLHPEGAKRWTRYLLP
jgi:ATP-dependent DNA helicase RecG